MSIHQALRRQSLIRQRHIAWVLIGLAPWLIPTLFSTPSADDFFRPAKISHVQISPDGRTVAGLAPIGDTLDLGIVFIDLETMEHRSIKWKDGHDIYRLRWVSDEYVLFNALRWGMYAGGVYRANYKGRKIETMLDQTVIAELIDPMEDHPSDSLVWIRADARSSPSVAVLKKKSRPSSGDITDRSSENFRSLRKKEELPNGQTYGVFTDHNHTLRIVQSEQEGRLRYLHRPERSAPWQELSLDPDDWRIRGFTPDNQKIYVTGYGDHETEGLHLYDLKTEEMGETLFRDENYDLSWGSQFKFYQDNLIGLTYHRDSPITVWFDEGLRGIQAFIDRTFPGRINRVTSWNRDFTRLLIATESPTSPATYVVLDLTTKEFTPITQSAPWIDQESLSPTQTIKFKTADGLALEGYVTLPRTGQAPYPAVNLVHGGPWVRDVGGFDAEAQYLASLGYAVIQVNYRGSAGYGRKVSEEPSYDFRAMHDDITRATQLLIKKKVIDPDRVAIMGASFGGYAALAGVAFEPDLYACAITNVGVFDWAEMVRARKKQRSFYAHNELVEEIGDPSDQEAYDAISPIRHVEAITAPVFIAHGRSDGNVSVQQSKKLESALRKQGVPHETYYRNWQGHGFRGKTRIEYYERVAAFLEKHL